MYLLDQDDTLYRLPSAKFNQMLRDPTRCRLPRFAGSRLRMTDVAVELIDRPGRLFASPSSQHLGYLCYKHIISKH
jgi:hypothetical protein